MQRPRLRSLGSLIVNPITGERMSLNNRGEWTPLPEPCYALDRDPTTSAALAQVFDELPALLMAKLREKLLQRKPH